MVCDISINDNKHTNDGKWLTVGPDHEPWVVTPVREGVDGHYGSGTLSLTGLRAPSPHLEGSYRPLPQSSSTVNWSGVPTNVHRRDDTLPFFPRRSFSPIGNIFTSLCKHTRSLINPLALVKVHWDWYPSDVPSLLCLLLTEGSRILSPTGYHP